MRKIFALLLVLAVTGCEVHSPNPLQPTEIRHDQTSVMNSDWIVDDPVFGPGSVSWGADNKLSVYDLDGNHWEAERLGTNGDWTKVVVARNGVPLGSVDIEWSNVQPGEAESFTYNDNTSSHWIQVDTFGSYLTSNIQSGSGDDTGEPGCGEEQEDDEGDCGDEGFWPAGEEDEPDCEDEEQEAKHAVMEATTVVGVGSLASFLTGGALAGPAAGASIVTIGRAVYRLADWAYCEMSGGQVATISSEQSIPVSDASTSLE